MAKSGLQEPKMEVEDVLKVFTVPELLEIAEKWLETFDKGEKVVEAEKFVVTSTRAGVVEKGNSSGSESKSSMMEKEMPTSTSSPNRVEVYRGQSPEAEDSPTSSSSVLRRKRTEDDDMSKTSESTECRVTESTSIQSQKLTHESRRGISGNHNPLLLGGDKTTPAVIRSGYECQVAVPDSTLPDGVGSKGGQRKRYRDHCHKGLKLVKFDKTWATSSQDRVLWRTLASSNAGMFSKSFQCETCGRIVTSRIGIINHCRTHATE